VTETNVFQLSQPGTFSDPLTEVLRKLKFYVAAPRYRRVVSVGATRIGLDGNPAGQVTQAEAAHALELAAQGRFRDQTASMTNQHPRWTRVLLPMRTKRRLR
jgi:sRNA-binding protein